MITLPVMESPGTETNGDRVRAARKREGLTLEGLGKQLVPEQNKQQIHKLENNQVKIRPPMARQLADILGGSPLDYVDAEYAGATSLAGAADRGRAWEDPMASNTAGADFDITAAQFRDAYVGLVRAYAGDDVADEVAGDDFEAMLVATKGYLAGQDGDLTSLLSEYLLVSAAGDSGVSPTDDRFDLERWRRLARQTAQLLTDMAAPPTSVRRRRK